MRPTTGLNTPIWHMSKRHIQLSEMPGFIGFLECLFLSTSSPTAQENQRRANGLTI